MSLMRARWGSTKPVRENTLSTAAAVAVALYKNALEQSA